MPQRVNNLMEEICRFDNLNEAFLRAAKGKTGYYPVVAFRKDYDRNIRQMARSLADGTFQFGKYHFFTIFDPKKRRICAASFPERVAFHALMRVCHPFFENRQIYDSYASRIGKGTYVALDRARHFARKYQYFAKIDVCKYFDSINHSILFRMLCRIFKDEMLLDYFYKIIDTYSVGENRGLPIGNLTSQYFANHYLTYADRFLQVESHIPGLVRYMDDTLIFSNDKDQILTTVAAYKDFLAEKLDLQIHPPVINRTCHGAPFLGYVVYADGLRLSQRSRHRFREKMAVLQYLYDEDIIDEKEISMRSGSMFAFINKADVLNFRRSLKGICL